MHTVLTTIYTVLHNRDMSNGVVTYRKTRNGEYVAYGPATIVREGVVTITKRDGSTKQVMVSGVGRTFTVDGIGMRYGYIDSDITVPAPAPARKPAYAGQQHRTNYRSASRHVCHLGRVCDECA